MSYTNRREFLRASSALALAAAVPADLFAQAATVPVPSGTAWDTGVVRHLLPTVSDTRCLSRPRSTRRERAPRLRVGDTPSARMRDTPGERWHFYATDLRPDGRINWRLPARRAPLFASRGSLRPFRRRTRGRTGAGFSSSPARAAMRP